MKTTIWQDILRGSGTYQVSNTGLVKSFKNGRWGTSLVKERLLKPGTDARGYLHVTLSHDGIFLCKIHRLVAEAFIPNPDNLPEVNHKDGNKLNNNDWNLEWCTSSGNHLHAYATGLRKGRGKSKNKKLKS